MNTIYSRRLLPKKRDNALIQIVAEARGGYRAPAHAGPPYLIRLHAEVEAQVRMPRFQELSDKSIELYPNRLEIAHFSIQANHELTVKNRRCRMALPDNRFEGGHESERTDADPDNTAGVDLAVQKINRSGVIILPAPIRDERIEMKTDGKAL